MSQPLASSLGPVNPGTAGSTRQLPPHKGAGAGESPNGARLQALANVASRRRVGTMKNHPKMPEASAHKGKNLPAHDAEATKRK